MHKEKLWYGSTKVRTDEMFPRLRWNKQTYSRRKKQEVKSQKHVIWRMRTKVSEGLHSGRAL